MGGGGGGFVHMSGTKSVSYTLGGTLCQLKLVSIMYPSCCSTLVLYRIAFHCMKGVYVFPCKVIIPQVNMKGCVCTVGNGYVTFA